MIDLTSFSTGFLSAAPSWLGVDIVAAIRTSDLIGQLIMLMLALLSVSSWGLIFFKYFQIQQASKQTEQFQEIMTSGSCNFDDIFQQSADLPDSPLAQIFRETYLELQVENWYRGNSNINTEGRINIAKIGVERVMERIIANEISYLERHVPFLATVASISPLMGLFGTVWGVMGAFQVLASQGSANIQSLGPGLSTALATTIAGLVAAIPAAVFFNFFLGKTQILITRMDSFALELSNVIQKQIFKEQL